MDQICIRMLGSFHLLVNGCESEDALSRTPKGLTLVQCLLVHAEETVPVQTLCDVLGLSGEGALKTLVSRTRHTLRAIHPRLSDSLRTVPGGYSWHVTPDTTLDTLRLQALAGQLHAVHTLDEDTRPLFEEATALYQGELLGDRCREEWLAGHASAFQAIYVALINRYLNALQAASELDEMLRVCRIALTHLPFSESLHLRMTDITLAAGHVTQPGDALALQSHLIRAGRTLDESMARLRQDLVRPQASEALICDSGLLRSICGLFFRTNERSGQAMYLGLLLVNSADRLRMHPLRMDVLVDELLHHLAQSLRRSDIVSRTAPDQVAVLIPTGSEEGARLTLERVTKAFLASRPTPDCQLTYRLARLSPTP